MQRSQQPLRMLQRTLATAQQSAQPGAGQQAQALRSASSLSGQPPVPMSRFEQDEHINDRYKAMEERLAVSRRLSVYLRTHSSIWCRITLHGHCCHAQRRAPPLPMLWVLCRLCASV